MFYIISRESKINKPTMLGTAVNKDEALKSAKQFAINLPYKEIVVLEEAMLLKTKNVIELTER